MLQKWIPDNAVIVLCGLRTHILVYRYSVSNLMMDANILQIKILN